AAYYPEAAVADYFAEKVTANLAWLDDYARGVSNPADPRFNPLHVMWTGYRPEPGFISLWEQTYLAYAIDRANQQGFIGGLQHRDAIAGLQLRLFTDADWPRVDANGAAWSAPYLLGVGVPGTCSTTTATGVGLDSRPGWALDSYPPATPPPPVNTAPTFAPPADITTTATSAAGATVSFTVASGADAEDGPLTPSCSPASGSTFAIGTTPV